MTKQVAILKSIEKGGGTFQIVSENPTKIYVSTCWIDGEFEKDDLEKTFYLSVERV